MSVATKRVLREGAHVRLCCCEILLRSATVFWWFAESRVQCSMGDLLSHSKSVCWLVRPLFAVFRMFRLLVEVLPRFIKSPCGTLFTSVEKKKSQDSDQINPKSIVSFRKIRHPGLLLDIIVASIPSLGKPTVGAWSAHFSSHKNALRFLSSPPGAPLLKLSPLLFIYFLFIFYFLFLQGVPVRSACTETDYHRLF